MKLNLDKLESTTIYVVKVHDTCDAKNGRWQNMKSFLDENLAMLYATQLREEGWKLAHVDVLGLYRYSVDLKPLDVPV